MTFNKFKNNKLVKIISNKFFIILFIFSIWMLFFDANSYLNHRELNEEIQKLENSNKYYRDQISTDEKIISNLNDPDSLEKFAREEYKMKKKNEEIYIIEFDTLNKK